MLIQLCTFRTSEKFMGKIRKEDNLINIDGMRSRIYHKLVRRSNILKN